MNNQPMTKQQIDLSIGESFKVGSYLVKLIGANACEAIFEVEGPDGGIHSETVELQSNSTEALGTTHAVV